MFTGGGGRVLSDLEALGMDIKSLGLTSPSLIINLY